MGFIVRGAPRSANASPASRRRWRERVEEAARQQVRAVVYPTEDSVSVLIIYFHQGQTTLDVDNIGKPLLDALTGPLLFRDDVQISELMIRNTAITSNLSLTGASPFLLAAVERAIQEGADFVYVRIDAAPDHSRIP